MEYAITHVLLPIFLIVCLAALLLVIVQKGA